MKKILILLALCASVTVNAQPWFVADLLNARSIIISNAAAVTNLSLVSGLTNRDNVVFTNRAGTRVITGATNNTFNLLGDVALWTDREGRPFSTNLFQTPASVVVSSYQTSADTNVLTVILTPVWEGVTDKTGARTYSASTAPADWFSFQMTPGSSSTRTILATNLPISRWQGAQGVALLRLATTNVTETTNQIIVDKVRVVGFRP